MIEQPWTVVLFNLRERTEEGILQAVQRHPGESQSSPCVAWHSSWWCKRSWLRLLEMGYLSSAAKWQCIEMTVAFSMVRVDG